MRDSVETILVTGGAGFIGSNFIRYFLDNHPRTQIINFDKLTYAGSLENLAGLDNDPRYRFIQGDICDRERVADVFDSFDIRGIIHIAAESHVDNSINNPDQFIKSNIYGTYMLLEVSRQKWMNGPHRPKNGYETCRFHNVSTDEVYGSLGGDCLFTETSPYAPNSPYSATKASADMLVRSYFHTYGLNVVTTNCSNNYGPRQHSEKFIPTIIRNAVSLQPIPVYGDGLNVRDWLYVLDHCRGIDVVYHHGVRGTSYNIGGNNEKSNIDVVRAVCGILDKIAPAYKEGTGVESYEQLITFVSDRPGHDRRYAIDSTRISTELGWEPEQDFTEGLRHTVKWYLDNGFR